MGDGPADRPPVADLRVPDTAGHIVEKRIAVPDDVGFVDLAMGGTSADMERVVALDDRVQAADRLKVDEQLRLREPKLHQREQAVAAGQQLRLTLPLDEDAQHVVQTPRTNVVELARDHRAGPSSRTWRGRLRPIATHDGPELSRGCRAIGRAAP